MASRVFTRSVATTSARVPRRRLATLADPPSSSSSSTTIPVVDFGYFLSGSPLHRTAVARQVVDAFKKVGFVYLGNTKVCEGDERKEVFEMVRQPHPLPSISPTS